MLAPILGAFGSRRYGQNSMLVPSFTGICICEKWLFIVQPRTGLVEELMTSPKGPCPRESEKPTILRHSKCTTHIDMHRTYRQPRDNRPQHTMIRDIVTPGFIVQPRYTIGCSDLCWSEGFRHVIQLTIGKSACPGLHSDILMDTS